MAKSYTDVEGLWDNQELSADAPWAAGAAVGMLKSYEDEVRAGRQFDREMSLEEYRQQKERELADIRHGYDLELKGLEIGMQDRSDALARARDKDRFGHEETMETNRQNREDKRENERQNREDERDKLKAKRTNVLTLIGKIKTDVNEAVASMGRQFQERDPTVAASDSSSMFDVYGLSGGAGRTINPNDKALPPGRIRGGLDHPRYSGLVGYLNNLDEFEAEANLAEEMEELDSVTQKVKHLSTAIYAEIRKVKQEGPPSDPNAPPAGLLDRTEQIRRQLEENRRVKKG